MAASEFFNGITNTCLPSGCVLWVNGASPTVYLQTTGYSGAFFTSEGVAYFTRNGYAPLGAPVNFILKCSDYADMHFTVTMNDANGCNLNAKTVADQTITADTTMDVAEFFSGITGTCKPTGCTLDVFDTDNQ